MIKITYLTTSADTKKPEKTNINIFNGRVFATYDVKGKAEATVKQMKQDNRKGVLYSRGAMIQVFRDKTEEEILEIVKKDIYNGVEVAKKKTGKELEIKDLVITRT